MAIARIITIVVNCIISTNLLVTFQAKYAHLLQEKNHLRLAFEEYQQFFQASVC